MVGAVIQHFQNKGVRKNMAPSYLDQIRKLTESLPDLSEYVKLRSGDIIDYDVDHGRCRGVNLLNNGLTSVQYAELTAGTVFPEHDHGQIEILVIVTGSVVVRNISLDEVLKSGDVVRFRPGEMHKLVALEDTKLLGITIPSCQNYPGDPDEPSGKAE